jgi:hypothetical protein
MGRRISTCIDYVYALVTALVGYGVLNAIGHYNFIDWAIWLLVASLPPWWLKRRQQKCEP